jgi:ABC-type sugar transport system ATPase subunit
MYRLEAKNISKKFGEINAVNNLSFNCKEGEAVVLLGPTGAGKTTTLRCLAGLEELDNGDIHIDGKNINNFPPNHREVAMFFENYALYPHMTVYENMAYPLSAPSRKNEYNKKKINERVQEVAELLQISELLDRKPNQLSGGQKQRTALGRTLVRKPKVFLLDEPIAHLDAVLRHRMRGEMKSIFQKLQCTVVYVTHDYKEALSIGDKILVIKKGELVQLGTADDIWSKMDDIFVAKLVGDPPINIYNGVLHLGKDNLKIELKKQETSIVFKPEKAEKENLGKWAGKEVLFAIRPNDINISTTKKANSIKGTLAAIEAISSSYEITVYISEKKIFKVKSKINFADLLNKKIYLNIDSEKIHLFNPQNGESIYHGRSL